LSSGGLDLDAYLGRTGASRPLVPSREALFALHRAHVAAIPFENLDEPHHPVDFVMANHFTSTFSRSPFLLNLIAQRSWPERRAILRNRHLVVRESGAGASTTVRDPEHLLEVLADVFSLVFPAGTRFPRPEF
jgi:arylamine N-acetyltransferase